MNCRVDKTIYEILLFLSHCTSGKFILYAV